LGFLLTPSAFDAPVGRFLSEYCHAVWYGKKLEWCGYPTVKNFEDMLVRFDRMYERDGHTHTDRQTDRHTHTPHDSIGRACNASRGKKMCSKGR